MNLIFFQNCISPHQMPYIKELPFLDQVDKVVVVSPIVDADERSKMGWNANKYLEDKNIEFLIAPKDEEIISLFERFRNSDSRFLFSGITGFKEVEHWLQLSLSYKIQRSIITEPPFIYGHPIWMHIIKFLMKDFKYVKYFNNVFVMGDRYLWFYRLFSHKWKVVPFMYCTEWKERTMPAPTGDKLKLLYVGSLIDRKNVEIVFEAIKNLPEEKQKAIEFGIVGNGILREKLENLSKHVSCTTNFYGSVAMEDVSSIMQQHDALILPSKHDGWGAVVNEALTLGLYTICSKNCGARILLKENIGKVFYSLKDLINILNSLDYNLLRRNINSTIQISKDNYSGEKVANYLYSKLK